MIELQSQNYLLAVTRAEFAANIAGRNVYLASEFKFIGLSMKDMMDDAVRLVLPSMLLACLRSFFLPSLSISLQIMI